MKRIAENRKLFGVTKDATLAEIKKVYRNLMKEVHPDKFQEESEKLAAEEQSKVIITGYNFLVSLSPETHARDIEDYTATITTSGIYDFVLKGQTLKVTFNNGSIYEYFGVTKDMYNKMNNSPSPARYARRHIFESLQYVKAMSLVEKEA